MSSILIKGMKMPKGRPLCIVIDPAGQARRYDLNNDKYADDELFEAVSVPPHGDLIERDKLREKEFIHDGDAYAVVMSRDIRNAPTIIEAELPVHHGTFAAASEKEATRRLTGGKTRYENPD